MALLMANIVAVQGFLNILVGDQPHNGRDDVDRERNKGIHQ